MSNINSIIFEDNLPKMHEVGARYGKTIGAEIANVPEYILDYYIEKIEDFDKIIMNNSNDEIPKIIQSIWNKLDNVRYGIWDDKTKTPIYMDTDIEDKRLSIKGYLDKNCRILTPKEVLQYKLGTCWDQTLCICYLAYIQNLNFDVYYYECENNKHIPIITHMVSAVQYKNYWYLMEHTFGKIYGIHKCKTVKDCWKIEDDARAKVTNITIVYKNTNFAKKLIPLFTNKNIKVKTIINITGTTFNFEES